ncbi:neutral zinc metallopeptidase [Nocardioides sp. MH1]|uniref:KPN_02809 family neutral zinc metallopeptidase n=1 Tax=Nocardioides sp. MH1 TaxID=3242490 RepID=UPI003521AF4A
MRFNPKARLDRSRIRDAGRGSGGGGGLGGGGGMRLPIPSSLGGKGIGGIVLLIVLFVVGRILGVDLLGGGSSVGSNVYDPARLSSAGGDTGRYDDCKTGDDANSSADCARVAVENSLADYWGDQLGGKFEYEEGVVTFTGDIQTGCGDATADVGPFYCPTDETIYLDTSFYKDVLQGQLGGPSGAFVEPYVLAHEYGHHIQKLLGFMKKVKTQEGPNSDSVRLELQADCYAGMWANHATTTEDAAGEVLILDLTQDDIDTAMAAAQSVGDDRIQQETQGSVDEESWTHGSAAERQGWFMVGYKSGDLDQCAKLWEKDRDVDDIPSV